MRWLRQECRQADFHVPSLSDLAAAIGSGLAGNYSDVDVDVARCPDLRKLGCVSPGICGDALLIEIGGEPLVHNPKYRDLASIDLREILDALNKPNASVLGAGFPSLAATDGRCGELMPCMEIAGRNFSKLARVGDAGQCVVEDYRSRLHGGLGNLYVCDGHAGDVVRVEVRGRHGSEASLSQAIRTALIPLVARDKGQEIALGGVFSIVEGRVRAHISPDFECISFPYFDTDREEVVRQDFLKFYDGMGPGLTCMSVLWTGDPTGGELHLRPSGEHTHFFSSAGRSEAGHYHFDVSPESIHCVGHFHPAKRVVRVADIHEALKSDQVEIWQGCTTTPAEAA